MTQTSREVVRATLKFENPDRVARDLWALPYAELHFPERLAELHERYPSDFGRSELPYRPSGRVKGDAHTPGLYTDEWGCVFTNIQAGLIGEVREPILKDLADWESVWPPYETLPDDVGAARDIVNRSCGESDKFILMNACARPWERYQFIRGTENAMMDCFDFLDVNSPARKLLDKIHEFYLREMEFWVSTDVDSIMFMDDWGSQRQLLIPPLVWREVFKKQYRDYCELARSHNKFAFMHSDGHIQEVYPDLVEVGVDAVNSQLFCMDMQKLAETVKGKITFWGEIDRQHVMTSPDPQAGRDAVRKVAKHLFDPAGGVIAQFELGAAANPDVAFAVYDEWEKVYRENC